MAGDTLTVVGDPQAASDLLLPVMRNGRRLAPSPPLSAVRAHLREELARLPEPLQRLATAPPYPVTVAPALQQLAEAADRATGLQP